MEGCGAFARSRCFANKGEIMCIEICSYRMYLSHFGGQFLMNFAFFPSQWVETCVRPREGLTRAMLEMYMHDGGTLGDVLHALLHLECLDILESVRPKVESFLEERSRRSDDVDNSTNR